MQLLSTYWPYIILCVFLPVFVAIWGWLSWENPRLKRTLRAYLHNLVSILPEPSDRVSEPSLDKQISYFITDVREAIHHPPSERVRRDLYQRLVIKDQARPCLQVDKFELGYSIGRIAIELFPLLGILGTVLAIAAALNASEGSDPDMITQIVHNFGKSVVSTGLGIFAAIVFMVWNGFCEPGFERSLAYAGDIQELISLAKKELGLKTAAGELDGTASDNRTPLPIESGQRREDAV